MKKSLASSLQNNRSALLEYFKNIPHIGSTPFYSSMDLRDSGFKIAPVDDNLFPAGFNNICPEDQRTAPPLLKRKLDREMESRGLAAPQRVMILPEHHTQNLYYLDNLWHLQNLLTQAGFEVKCGWFLETMDLKSASDYNLRIEKIQISSGTLKLNQWEPDAIILNNDFSGGYPPELDTVRQPILPPHHLGWHRRRKATFFKYYNQHAQELAQILQTDPWSLQVMTEEVNDVDFNEGIGLEKVEAAVARVLETTQKAYQERGISDQAFAFIKSNTGTYGMGITVVHSLEELRAMNRRTKNKMSVGKNRSEIKSVIIQEGIRTSTKVENLTSEPVIYLVGCDLIGGFMRANTERSTEDNLNSQGMVFKKLCMSDLRGAWNDDIDEEPMLELVYGTIARLAAAAAARELSEMNLLERGQKQ